ncbi:MAG: hypothetical protein MJ182_10775 [Treponema sp.]|nr:hypothetical protein [Treponema sp.]
MEKQTIQEQIDTVDSKIENKKKKAAVICTQDKNNKIKKNAKTEKRKRAVENQIKYMIGGLMLSIRGKDWVISTLEKSNLDDYQQGIVDEYYQFMVDEINEKYEAIGGLK